ncbi:PQQ-binding-like beta-propeller repeat protein [Halovenus rubra]|uniref:PQQ-binding-like beta-propeller repeat protein n=2 Tax=Halovenus rubra TaxID=869890 RepID=A0ABD5X973_9EURY|nr:PQQ-binding-like beta-propeller repeat protein [Halovenus rubra]
MCPPVRVGETVVAADCQTELAGTRRRLYGIGAETGEIEWERRTYPSELSVANETVYTTAGDAATAFDPETGDVLWRYPTGVGHLTATEGGIYAVGRNNDGTSTLYALDEGGKT